MTTLAIDLETYSDNPIQYGVHRYVDTPAFEILLLGYAFDDEPVAVADLTKEGVPARVRQALFDSSITKTAFNANFEITCLRTLYPDMPDTSWECSSVLALYNSLPTGLANVAKILKLGDDQQKDTRGKALIRYFSLPCKPTKANGGRTRNMPSDAPDKWAEYIEYNRQDVVVERAIRRRLLVMKPPEAEHRLWLLDRKINDAGCAVDQKLVRHAIQMHDAYRERLLTEAAALTGLDNPNSVPQLLNWVESRLGREVEGLAKKKVKELLAGDIPADVRRMLRIRQLLGKTSIKKYNAMDHSVAHDGRIHDLFQFYGASRTGRWAGRNVQLQNLPRNSLADLDTARRIVQDGDLDTLELLYDNVPDTLSQLIRTALVPSPGKRFIVADFSAIEARVIAWLAGEQWRMEVFANGGDIYCASASAMFHVPVEKHGVNGHLRQKGKIAELALGYGGSVGAHKAMGALEMGLSEDELPALVSAWRQANPKIVQFWWAVDRAVMDAVTRKTTTKTHGIIFSARNGMLFITLPSGRSLAYVKPKIGENRFGGDCITYEGVGGTKKWERIDSYGPKFVENIVQATSRDILCYAMKTLRCCSIVMHIHDELVIEADRRMSLQAVCDQMSRTPPWASGLQLRADGYETDFYKKD